MRKHYLTILLLVFSLRVGYSQVIKTKLIDQGGSGNYPSIAVTEQSLPDFVVYRPENIQKAAKQQGKLPILVWANGGCMNSSIHQERLLSEIASHGYIIVAIGTLQMTVEERVHESTADDELLKALDWITKQARTQGSDYYDKVDLDKIAAGGHSCGGAQTLRIANDARIKTYLILNAGMGNMTMAGASSASLPMLHAPIIYMIGGKTDIAYENAVLDYDRISHVPVVFADHTTAGHGATFSEKYGGSFAQLTIDWLDWQFKNKDNSHIFLNNDLSDYPGWTMKAKGFETETGNTAPMEFTPPALEFVCELQVTIDDSMSLGATPHGDRIIIPITGGTFSGPKMKGVVLNGGADYQYRNQNLNRTELNAIYTIKTDDGVLIHIRNTGLIHEPSEESSKAFYFRAAPKFEAPIDSKYAWLNNAIYVCKPEGKDGYISIQVWKVL
ncbi:DUF3237 family protein [Flavobacteriaceae bacterium GSB9]|nr:DUF3237 family protein [Flavobacteriaceae bacterium GSB9]